ncbi:hypothetical protein BDZ45DRAFT_622010 [Acephala macrosclerotiorum]|nr:hypothetical protein BDZ45DRAFT_622010 [Acephala macrosclerotiorum]
MAAPGFGFSFGDFVQAISILNAVRKALKDTGGANDEFKHVRQDLEHLEILLEQLNRGDWDHGADAGHLNAVRGLALTCKVPLQDFLVKIEKFKKLSNHEVCGIRDKVGSAAKKVCWAVGMREQVERFRAVIVAKIASINLLLQMNAVSTISKIDMRTQAREDSATAFQTRMDDRLDVASKKLQDVTVVQEAVKQNVSRLVKICAGTSVGVDDIRKSVNAQHANIRCLLNKIERRQRQSTGLITQTSMEVVLHITKVEKLLRELLGIFGGFSIPALQLLRRILQTNLKNYAILRQIQCGLSSQPMPTMQDSIHFTDALGRTQKLQYQLVKYWEVFEAMLKCVFEGLPGEHQVLEGQYHVLNARQKGLIIDRNRWERSIFPGSEVSMSIVITIEVFSKEICLQPGCCEVNRLTNSAAKKVICSACQLEYPRIDEDSRDEVDFTLDLNDPAKVEQLQKLSVEKKAPTSSASESTQLISLSKLMSLSERRYATPEDLDAFKMVHISFGSWLGPRTGFPIVEGRVSPENFQREAFRASRWPLSKVLRWLSDNYFPREFERAFMDLCLQGHAFFHLQEDTETLKWRLIRDFESGNVSEPIRSLTLQGYKRRLNENLSRLSQFVRDIKID